MKLLLDTHTLLWWWKDDARLSANARTHIEDTNNDILVSAASAWEIAAKYRIGKLVLADSVIPRYRELLEADGFSPLPIKAEHALLAGSYPQPHRDPFDRILAAQAEVENLELVSHDRALALFGAKLLW